MRLIVGKHKHKSLSAIKIILNTVALNTESSRSFLLFVPPRTKLSIQSVTRRHCVSPILGVFAFSVLKCIYFVIGDNILNI